MAYTTVQIPATTGNILIAAEQAAGVVTFHSVPEVAGSAVAADNPLPGALIVEGAPVSSSNPAPVADANVGAISDAAWIGTGNASAIALLKALWGLLNGGLFLLDGDGSNKASINALGALLVSQSNGLTVVQTVRTLTANSSTQLIAANLNRRYLALMNIGVAAAVLNFNAPAVLGEGWPLGPAGTAGSQGGGMVWEGTGVSTDAIYAIAGGSTTIVVLEGE